VSTTRDLLLYLNSRDFSTTRGMLTSWRPPGSSTTGASELNASGAQLEDRSSRSTGTSGKRLGSMTKNKGAAGSPNREHIHVDFLSTDYRNRLESRMHVHHSGLSSNTRCASHDIGSK
jgi:hypothetical protein